MPDAGPTAIAGEEQEWLEADGRGGFASGTAAGVRTRRYHALLLTATSPPTGRVVLVNGIEAWVTTQAGRFPLSTHRYAPDVIYPRGFEYIAAFASEPWPRWTFRLPGGTEIRHEVIVDADGGDVLLQWSRTGGQALCRLDVRPLLSGRDYHALQRENDAFDFTAKFSGGNVIWQAYGDRPAVSAITNGGYDHAPTWYRQFVYAAERDRGLDDIENLASPGTFGFDLAASEPAVIVLRAGTSAAVRALPFAERMVASARAARPASSLRRAAAAYRADRAAGRTLLAGFPWFTDWGRDTFIAARGLLLGLGERDTAAAILTAWAGAVSSGMLPNRFPDAGSEPEYNSVDASLWYVVVVHEYLAACEAAGQPAKADVAEVLRTACLAIIDGYTAGTRFGIRADTDGLLTSGAPGLQLTWMDAKIGDWVVTPRRGKPVEIQALWFNALSVAGSRWSTSYREAADRARTSFAQRFPNPAGGLFDVVDVEGIAGDVDASVRPNQIMAVGGLPFAIVDGGAARAIVDLVETKLVTPLGLRSLSPDDPAYIGRYEGDPHSRDSAYHQGTVWPWLMGPFVDAWLAVRSRTAAAKSEGRRRFLPALEAHLATAGLGHISEVADGDAPHRPGGCPFQAWSLGEYIRIRRMLDASND